MILFLSQRGTKAYNLNIAGVFIGSLEGAATVRIISFIYVLNIIYILDKEKLNNYVLL